MDATRTSLETLVERTEGLQPWRRAFHAGNALTIACGLSFVPLGRTRWALVLGAVAVTLLAADLIRLRVGRLNALFFQVFRPLASPREAAGIASSTWYVLGIALAVTLAPLDVAVSAVLVLGLADPAASYLGRRWGRRPLLGGTVEGTLVFLTVTLLILLLRHPWPLAVGAALLVTLAERRAWPLDDNFAIPVTCAAVLTLAGALL